MNPIEVSARQSATAFGLSRMLAPSDSRTSALPDPDDTLRPPCLATRAPAAAATNIAAVEILNVCAPSPPVPQRSTRLDRSAGSTCVANSRMICAAAAISPIVSFLTRRPIVSAAICTGVSSPLISRRHNDSISSWKISRCSMHRTSASLGVIDMDAPRTECRNRSKHLPLCVQVSAPDCGLRHVGHEWIGSIQRRYAPGACRKFFSIA